MRTSSSAAVLAAAYFANAAAPQLQVDPFWPKALPNHWLLGQVAGVRLC